MSPTLETTGARSVRLPDSRAVIVGWGRHGSGGAIALGQGCLTFPARAVTPSEAARR